MNEREFESIIEAVDIAMQEGGITVHVSKKSVLTLFGAVIAANVATVFVLQGMTAALKEVAQQFKEKTDKPIDEFTEFVKNKAENVPETDTEDQT